MAGQMMQHPSAGGAPPPPPRPPRKIPYRDGISKSVPYNDIYEMIRRPSAHPSRRPPDPPPHYNDPYYHPPTKQQKLEKKLQKRFEKNHYRLPGKSLEVAGKVLKMMILFFGLPLYLILYTVPKFIFLKAIPFFFGKISAAVRGCFCKIKAKSIEWQNLLLKKKTALISSIENKILIPARSIFLYFSSCASRLNIRRKAWIEKIKVFFKTLAEYPHKLNEKTKDKFKNLKSWNQQKKKFFKGKIEESKENVTNWILEKEKKLLQKLTFFKRISLLLKSPFSNTRSLFIKLSSLVRGMYDEKKNRLKNQWNGWKKHVLTEIHSQVKKFEARFILPIRKKIEWMQAKFGEFQNKIYKKFYGYHKNIQINVNQFKTKISLSKIPEINIEKLYPLSRPAINFSSLIVPVKEKISLLREKVKSLEVEVKERMRFSPPNTDQWLNPIRNKWDHHIQRVRIHCAHIIFRIRWLAAWSTVLTKYSFQLVKVRADEIGIWLAMTGLGIA